MHRRNRSLLFRKTLFFLKEKIQRLSKMIYLTQNRLGRCVARPPRELLRLGPGIYFKLQAGYCFRYLVFCVWVPLTVVQEDSRVTAPAGPQLPERRLGECEGGTGSGLKALIVESDSRIGRQLARSVQWGLDSRGPGNAHSSSLLVQITTVQINRQITFALFEFYFKDKRLGFHSLPSAIWI